MRCDKHHVHEAWLGCCVGNSPIISRMHRITHTHPLDITAVVEYRVITMTRRQITPYCWDNAADFDQLGDAVGELPHVPWSVHSCIARCTYKMQIHGVLSIYYIYEMQMCDSMRFVQVLLTPNGEIPSVTCLSHLRTSLCQTAAMTLPPTSAFLD
jgi:hypothetical protein